MVVTTLLVDQRLMRAHFDDLAMVDHHHIIRVTDGAQAVGKGSPSRRLDLLLRGTGFTITDIIQEAGRSRPGKRRISTRRNLRVIR